MDLTLYAPALLVAFILTLLEMTEVVVLVIAVTADHPTVRPPQILQIESIAAPSSVVDWKPGYRQLQILR